MKDTIFSCLGCFVFILFIFPLIVVYRYATKNIEYIYE